MDGTELTLEQQTHEARQRLWRVVGEIEACEMDIDRLKGQLRQARQQADHLYEMYAARLELVNKLEARAAREEGDENAA